MKNTSDHEINKAIHEIIDEMNMELASKQAPSRALADLIKTHTVANIRENAKIHSIAGYSKMNKQALADALAPAIANTEYMEIVLLTASEAQYDFFAKVATKGAYETEMPMPPLYEPLQRLYLLQLYFYEGKYTFAVPNEIQKAYQQLLKSDFPKTRAFYSALDRYAHAVVSLYGVMLLSDFVMLFNKHSKQKIETSEAEEILYRYSLGESDYCIWGEYLVNDEFAEDDFEDIEYVIDSAAGKPRYSPPKIELLQYADMDYYEKTPQVRALQRYLSIISKNDSERVQVMVDEMHDLCMQEAQMQEYFELLDEYDVALDFDNVQEITQLIVDMQNNTRLWVNNGHTPNELFRGEMTSLETMGTFQPKKKVGRNDPCPCGSGKKYKKCCLLKLN